MKWDEEFRNYLKELDSKKPVVLTGDLNVAHQEIGMIEYFLIKYFTTIQINSKIYLFRHCKSKN